MTKIQIVHEHTPKDRLAAILQTVEDDYKVVKDHCKSMLGSECPL